MSHDASLHQRLVELLRDKSVRRGRFTLASGRESTFYVDVRQTALHAEGSAIIGRLVHARLAKGVVGVGGLTLGADPIACAAAAVSADTDRPVHAFLVRKDPKGHGVERFVVGLSNFAGGDRVTVVEDTTTTGGSLLTAVQRVRQAGLQVVQCLTVVDRQEGAAEALAAEGLTLQPLTTRTELEEG